MLRCFAAQQDEQLELAAAQVDGFAVDGCDVGCRVDHQRAELEGFVGVDGTGAEVGANSCEEHIHRERFGDVVAGAGVETDNDVDF